MFLPPEIAYFTPEALGFYLPPLLMWGLLSLLPFLVLRWLLGRTGFYSFVWHRPLFDTALYVVVLGAVMLVMPTLAGRWG